VHKSAVLGLLAASVVAACANRPDSIHADFVSYERYTGLDCSALAQRLTDTDAKLADASAAQNNAANADAVGVFLVLVPVSKLTGDHEAEVAQLKGEKEAIETAQVKAKCRAP
jgi:hypothetical protein